jgi:hypothetical protein
MITDIYNTLTKEQQQLLNYAFENKISQLVELVGKRFIGVNIVATRYMVVEEEQNHWAIGRFHDDRPAS